MPAPLRQKKLCRAESRFRAQEPPATPAKGRRCPDQPNAIGDDAVAFTRVTRRVHQFDEAVPFGREIDGCEDREPALIEIALNRQALPLLEGGCERLDIEDV
jgi:hypothetical protein